MRDRNYEIYKREKCKSKEKFSIVEQFAKGQIIYRRGNSVMNVFYVKMGSVKLVNAKGGKQYIIQHIINEGQYFGVLDLFTPSRKRRLSAYSINNNTVLELIPLEVFEIKYKNQSEFTFEIWDSIRNLREESEWKYKVYLSDTINERLICCLMRLARIHGERVPSGFKFSMLTHCELGEYLGMSRQSITLVLNRLKRGNKIEYDRNTIIVKNELITEYHQESTSNLTL
ncbi:MAG: Crp/Fnr family transcriptional regulator [Bacteroidetes bacterium]|nr:MAG: Crp/Fnr family transcriptional regulator [Bacteroidota bacterium]